MNIYILLAFSLSLFLVCFFPQLLIHATIQSLIMLPVVCHTSFLTCIKFPCIYDEEHLSSPSKTYTFFLQKNMLSIRSLNKSENILYIVKHKDSIYLCINDVTFLLVARYENDFPTLMKLWKRWIFNFQL